MNCSTTHGGCFKVWNRVGDLHKVVPSFCVVFIRKAGTSTTKLIRTQEVSFPLQHFMYFSLLFSCSFFSPFWYWYPSSFKQGSSRWRSNPTCKTANSRLFLCRLYCSQIYPSAATDSTLPPIVFGYGQRRSLCKHNLTLLLKFAFLFQGGGTDSEKRGEGWNRERDSTGLYANCTFGTWSLHLE